MNSGKICYLVYVYMCTRVCMCIVSVTEILTSVVVSPSIFLDSVDGVHKSVELLELKTCKLQRKSLLLLLKNDLVLVSLVES